MNRRRRPAAARLIAALPLVCAMGCSSGVVQKVLKQLPEQPPAVSASKAGKSQRANEVGTGQSLPHGSGCICPEIVTGVSHGCWEAL